MLILDERKRTAHSFCGKFKLAGDKNKDRYIRIIVMKVGEPSHCIPAPTCTGAVSVISVGSMIWDSA